MGKLTDRQKELINSFKWQGDNEEGAEEHPLYDLSEQLSECAKRIMQYVVEYLNFEQFNQAELTMTVPIPINIHPMVEDIYSSKYTEDSRVVVFDLVRAMTLMLADSYEWKGQIEEQINTKVFPAASSNSEQLKQELKEIARDRQLIMSHETVVAPTKWAVRCCKIYDDPSVDVLLKSSAGDDRSYTVGGELVVEIHLTRKEQHNDT